MSGLRTALLAATALLMTTAAHADLVLLNNGVGFGLCTDNNCKSFQDLGGQGFGDFPRLLTLQTGTFEAGLATPGAGGSGTLFPSVLTGNAAAGGIISAVNNGIQTGTDKASTPTLAFLGWNTGLKVGVGFNADQTGQTGITLQQLTLGLYHNGTLIQTFSLDPVIQPVNYTAGDLAEEPGNGNAVFLFILDAAEQQNFNTLITADVLSNFEIGLAAALGCVGTPSATCQVTNDGPDSFVAFAAPGSPARVPVPGAVWLFGTGLAGLVVLSRANVGRRWPEQILCAGQGRAEPSSSCRQSS